ncbi:putative necrosis-inducing factor-domain-containing protein [Xylariaceae sp. FL1272]|nr:putative necrosis-inducing factor-domain-containing protein [Xylariaceae sp. FL1272]
MLSLLPIILAGLQLICQAVAQGQDNFEFSIGKDFKTKSKCRTALFYDETWEGSPSVADCQEMQHWFEEHPHTAFQLKIGDDESSHRIICPAKHGSCVFSYQRQKGAYDVDLAGGDIADLIRDSIAANQTDGVIEMYGEMECGEATVNWWIIPQSLVDDETSPYEGCLTRGKVE